jgi:uncharacterized delta-60 repeat protein
MPATVVLMNNAWAIDPSFGSTGIVQIVDPRAPAAAHKASALTSSGEGYLVVGGSQSFSIVKLTRFGTPDQTYGKDGWAYPVARRVPARFNETKLTVFEDGSSLVSAVFDERYPNHMLSRFKSNGQIDLEFGTASEISVTKILSNAYSWRVAGIVTRPNGAFEVVGDRRGDVYALQPNYEIIGFTKSGSIDASFGQSGHVSVTVSGAPAPDFGRTVSIREVVPLRNGGFMVIGSSLSLSSSAFVAKHKSDGTLDRTFGVDGFLFFERRTLSIASFETVDPASSAFYSSRPLRQFTDTDPLGVLGRASK